MVVAFDFVAEFLVIDSCLDRGGVFDYSRMECFTDPEGPLTFEFVPYPIRNHKFLVSIGFAAVVVAVGACLGWKPRLRR